ncbi:acyl-CoA thioesterase [Arthrobacter crusticola]|uniref:Acyl-CoA thioesterase n=1 Tax=Arthrobacter crusticola TaxID=2547960 RepID=A0A4R5TYY2_9MICC|nr:thioesterase family protein [Arthrobacter crusticola]TDK26469.1 acyl-CoA thioesterase [Arthrobacter crusticola]
MESPSQALTCHVPLRWGDMDAYGHINNVQVLRILEEARIAAFGPPAGTGLPGTAPQVELFSSLEPGVQALVVEHRVRYTAPLDYRNIPAVIDVWVSGLTPASLTLSYLIRDPESRTVCAKAETVLAFLRVEKGQLVRLDAEHRRLLEPHRAAPVFA